MNWVIIGGVSAAVVAKLAIGSRLLMQAQLVSKLPGRLRGLCSRRDLSTQDECIQLRPGVVANPSTPPSSPPSLIGHPYFRIQPRLRKELERTSSKLTAAKQWISSRLTKQGGWHE